MAAAAVCGVSAQQLWQESRVGMTIPEVLRAFPGATELSAPPKNGDGSYDGVQLPPVEIGGCPFEPRFLFQQDKLSAVRLTCKTESVQNTDRVNKALQEALRAKYGQEISREKNSIGTISAWYSSGTKIQLQAIQIGSGPGLVIVFYTPNTGRDAGKL